MSYTIPSTVQTKAEAVLAVASAIADEDMGARYDGTVNTSLDVLADVLAAQDVDVPQTNAGAILALAQYAHGGGGGGGDLTIAQVTITYDHEDTASVGISLPVAEEAYPPIIPEASSSTSDIDFTPDFPVPVVLYKGKCTTGYFGTGTVTTSGNATYTSENNKIIITGDCSITIS